MGRAASVGSFGETVSFDLRGRGARKHGSESDQDESGEAQYALFGGNQLENAGIRRTSISFKQQEYDNQILHVQPVFYQLPYRFEWRGAD